MKTITIVINGENVVSISPDRVAGAAGAYGISKIKFVLDEEWDDLELKCNFENAKGETPTEVMLDGNFECEIPSEALKYEGTTWFSLYGTDSDSKMINIRDWLTVGKSVSTGNSPTPPTPDLISQHNTNSESHNNKFGLFSDLYTTAKNTVVAAINELFDKFSDYLTGEETAQLVDDEANARTNADNTLQENIQSEASARANADGDLQSNIDDEVLARGEADTLKVDKDFTSYTAESSLTETDITLINKGDGTHKKSTLAIFATWILTAFLTQINSISQSIVSAVNNLYNFFNQKQFNGFEKEKDDYTCTYDEVNRTVTLSYAGGIYYWFNGVRYSLGTSWTSSAHPNDTTTKYYLKSTDGTNFVWSATAWTFDDIQVFISPSHRLYGFEEHHGTQDKFSHEGEHKGLGAMRDSGGDVTGFTLNSTTASQRRPTISECVLKDEDRKSVLPQQSGNYAYAYLSGATGTLNYAVDQADILRVSGNNPYYNLFTGGAWTEALLPNSPNVSSTSGYMCLWLLALPVDKSTRSRKYRFLWLQGQSQGNLASQQALTPLNVNLGDLLNESPEIIFLEKVIVRYTNGNWVVVEQSKITGSRVSQVSLQGAVFNGVTTDGTLGGNGTPNSPLSLPIVNNLTEGGTTVPLSAEMGKVLQNTKFDKEITLLSSAVDVDTLITSGRYSISRDTATNLPVDPIFATSDNVIVNVCVLYEEANYKEVYQELISVSLSGNQFAVARRTCVVIGGVSTFNDYFTALYYDPLYGNNLPSFLQQSYINKLMVAKLTRTTDGMFDFTGLSILSDGGIYDIIICGVETSASISMYINDDTNQLETRETYYYSAAISSLANSAVIMSTAASDYINLQLRLCLDRTGGLAVASTNGIARNAGGNTITTRAAGSWFKASAVNNITKIRIAAYNNANIATTNMTVMIFKRGA